MTDNKKIPVFKTVFHTLHYRNFRLFFVGQGISVTGTWMQQIAMGWLVYRMTNSPFLLGIVGFSSQLPMLGLTPLAGVVSDRLDRRRLIMTTQTLSMIQALLLAFLTLTGTIAVWHLIVLGAFLGCVNSFDIPGRQSFIVEMVEKRENFGNAIALNSLMFNAARLVGPSVAGIIIAMTGEGACFLINGISFIAAIAALAAMKIAPRRVDTKKYNALKELKEGVSYAYNFLPIRLILMLLSIISLMGMSYAVLLPIFARDILKGGPGTFGFMVASAGVGALAATVYLAMRRSVLGLCGLIPVFSFVFSIGLILFSISKTLWISIPILAFTGFGMMAHMASSNIILQTIVDDDKRGRVMSLYAMAFLGVAPFGSLLAGSLASMIGAANTLLAGGIISAMASLAFAYRLPALKKAIHPIYKKIGVTAETASGLNAVNAMVVPPED